LPFDWLGLQAVAFLPGVIRRDPRVPTAPLRRLADRSPPPLEEGTIAPSLFDEKNLAEISSRDFPAERLIARRHPLLAQYRKTKREALLRATEAELEKIVLAVKREKRPPRGKAKITPRVGRLIQRFKMARRPHASRAKMWSARRNLLERGPKSPDKEDARRSSGSLFCDLTGRSFHHRSQHYHAQSCGRSGVATRNRTLRSAASGF
jgi:hypothetical protein